MPNNRLLIITPTSPSYLHLHTGAMTRDLTVEHYSTWKDQLSSTCIEDTIVIKLENCQDATSDLPHHCTVSDCFPIC